MAAQSMDAGDVGYVKAHRESWKWDRKEGWRSFSRVCLHPGWVVIKYFCQLSSRLQSNLKLFSAMTGTRHPKSMEIVRPLWDRYFAILLNNYFSSSLPCSSYSRKGCPFHTGMHDDCGLPGSVQHRVPLSSQKASFLVSQEHLLTVMWLPFCDLQLNSLLSAMSHRCT